MKRKILFPLIALCIGCLLVFFIGELTLRILGWGPPYYTFDADVGYVIRPNAAFQVETGSEGGSRTIRSNSHGLRDVEHAYEKPAGVKRILVLGDSFCEALQVGLDDTFFRLLQNKLDGAPGGARFEVINTGVSGYGTDKELLFYRHEGRKYEPDIVMLFFVFNDVRNNDRDLQLRTYGERNEPYFRLEQGELRLHNYPAHRGSGARFRQLLRDHFYTYEFVWKLVKGAELSRRAIDQERKLPFDYTIYERPEPPEWEGAWAITAALLREVKAETERNGARFLVVGVTNDLQIHPDHREQMMNEYPAMREQRWDWDGVSDRLATICRDSGIEFLDLAPAFRERAEEHPSDHLHSFGGHWTAAGHAVCADTLYAWIEKRATSSPSASTDRGTEGAAEVDPHTRGGD